MNRSKGLMIILVLVLSFTVILANKPLVVGAETTSSNVTVNSSAPRSINVITITPRYEGEFMYQELSRHGTRYRGYMKLDFTRYGRYRYSGPLYRIDLPSYPIPTRVPGNEQLAI